MILYNNYVNYSVFDGEITIEKEAREFFLTNVFSHDASNKDIKLYVNGEYFDARLMNVASSKSVQISYKKDLKNLFIQIFGYSYNYWKTIREEAIKIQYSTRKLPNQTLEKIIVKDTLDPFVYEVECRSIYSNSNPFNVENQESEEHLLFPEGRKVYAKHVRYERNAGMVVLAKERFKQKYGTLYCEVCGFSFDVYGDRGKDYIEAHHDVIPVSELGEAAHSCVDDLRMVCSNCHKILHLKRPWINVDELKHILQGER